MAETKYTYTISTQTAANKVKQDILKREIENSSIVTAVNYINTDISLDKIDIYMADALSGADQSTLTATVGGHNPPTSFTEYWDSGAVSDSESGTTRTVYTAANSCNVDYAYPDDYNIEFMVEYRSELENTEVFVQVSLDGQELYSESSVVQRYQLFSGKVTKSLSGAHTVAVNVKSSAVKTSIYCKRCFISVSRKKF